MLINQNKNQFLGKKPFNAKKCTVKEFIDAIVDKCDYDERLIPIQKNGINRVEDLETLCECVEQKMCELSMDGNFQSQTEELYGNYVIPDGEYYGLSNSEYEFHRYGKAMIAEINGTCMLGYFATACEEDNAAIPYFQFVYFNQDGNFDFYIPSYGNFVFTDYESKTICVQSVNEEFKNSGEEILDEDGFSVDLYDETEETIQYYMEFIKDYAEMYGCCGDFDADCPEAIREIAEYSFDQMFEEIRSNINVSE